MALFPPGGSAPLVPVQTAAVRGLVAPIETASGIELRQRRRARAFLRATVVAVLAAVTFFAVTLGR